MPFYVPIAPFSTRLRSGKRPIFTIVILNKNFLRCISSHGNWFYEIIYFILGLKTITFCDEVEYTFSTSFFNLSAFTCRIPTCQLNNLVLDFQSEVRLVKFLNVKIYLFFPLSRSCYFYKKMLSKFRQESGICPLYRFDYSFPYGCTLACK